MFWLSSSRLLVTTCLLWLIFYVMEVQLIGVVKDSLLENGKVQDTFEYSTSIIQNEFIVQFDNYYQTNSRLSIIADAFHTRSNQTWKAIHRINPASEYPSDFSLIQIFSDTNEHIKDLEKHQLIKSVTHQRKVTRFLKNVNPNHADLVDNWFPRKLKRSSYDMNAEDATNHKSRKILRSLPRQITHSLQANILWALGYRGKGVKVAVFDTGLPRAHPHFKNVKDRTDWTDDKVSHDEVGHGTFVAGVISSDRECYGFAPDADLFIFRVFTNKQVSYTSWFLDAFNYAIMQKVDVLNLSIGGPDFMDKPFVDKVWELTANNIIMVSAIGNDGPLYGTLNNPADQMDVIGVGGISFDDQIAKFSSRGMTTWELPGGYGRVKPDIVTYGAAVRGSSLKGGCRSLSGTSVASPVVTGAIALLISSVSHRGVYVNPASVKQALIASATRIIDANIFEQGHGKLDLVKSYRELITYKPHASASPSYIDLTDCPYMWPYCTQPLYYRAMPLVVNVTLLNGMGVSGKIKGPPIWETYSNSDGHHLEVAFEYSELLWPWTGYLAVYVSVAKSAKDFEGVAKGLITLNITSPSQYGGEKEQLSTITIPLTVKILPTPSRSKRILWDQFHNLRYPAGYFPRDNLLVNNDPLDWNADHIHTNYRDLYHYLRKQGYFIEVLGSPFTCFDANDYGVLMLTDSEEEFFPGEISKLRNDVFNKKLSLIVIGEWYNTDVMKKIKFFDENTRQWWTPETGGANVPALNELMEGFGIAFSNEVYHGKIGIGDNILHYSSGTSVLRFPSDSVMIYADKLTDQVGEILHGDSKSFSDIPILGFNNPSESPLSGRIAVYGDSNCLDSAHLERECFWLMDHILNYTLNFEDVSSLLMKSAKAFFNSDESLPDRLEGNKFHQYSKVIEKKGEQIIPKPLPTCPSIRWTQPFVINGAAPVNLFHDASKTVDPT